MTGSGKSDSAQFFKDQGYEVLRFGSVVDDAVKEAGLPWTPENTALYRRKLREELGMGAIAIKMLPKIKEYFELGKKIVLDGLYSWEEYEILSKEFDNLLILCIYASPKTRYQRLEIRPDRPFKPEDARKRDIDEIVSTNKGGPIALADYLIKNEGTKEDFTRELELFIEKIQND
jgi:dephospho-CoA kinase